MNLQLYISLLKELAQNPKLKKERKKLKSILKESKHRIKLRGGFIFKALALSQGAGIVGHVIAVLGWENQSTLVMLLLY